MIGALSGLLFPIILIALVIFGIRKFKSGDAHGAIEGHTVRRFFQYLLLYGLIVISSIGLTGLLGRLFQRSTLVAASQSDLARNLSFMVVGVPLYIILALWTRRKFAEDSSEETSFGWSFYLTLTSVTSLIVGMLALNDIVGWAIRIRDYRSQAVAQLIVWGAVWAVHWWVHLRFTPLASSRVHHLLGSLVSLVTVVMGLSTLISGTIQRVWNLVGDAIFVSHGNQVLRGVSVLVVGAPVWCLYWIRNYSKAIKDPLWFVYVLLVGVGGGLIMAVASASTVLYSAFVWFIGDAGSATAGNHFRNVPSAIGATFVGVIAWWYHHAILEEERKRARTEVQRVYEYLISAIGLLAAAGGLAMILVALVEALTSSSVITGSGATNALLLAATLLIVGAPVWWIFWNRIQVAVVQSPSEEHSSSTRRVYLFVLFGLGGIVAVVTVLVGVFFLFDDIFKGNFGMETIRRMRFALAILVATGAIAGYHWMVYRSERELIATVAHGPRFVLLIGPKDPELSHAVSRYTHGRVQSWVRKDDQGATWVKDEVIHALEESQEESIILLADSKGMRVIPIDR